MALQVPCDLCILLLLACGDADFEYTRHRAYFLFENNLHLNDQLSAAMNPQAPGIFCRISMSGANRIAFQNNMSSEPKLEPLSAPEAMRRIELGVYNESGIIVGYGNSTDPAIFFAYDAQCPNCYGESDLPRYRLSMDSAGKATCGSCRRVYDLNSRGLIVSGGEGNKLMRYRASTTGPNGTLTVNN